MKEMEFMADKEYMCPHCDQKAMLKWQSPDDSNWGGEIKYVCFKRTKPILRTRLGLDGGAVWDQIFLPAQHQSE